MNDVPAKPDYRSTVFLPKTDFPMKAGLAQKEPAILARWAAMGLYQRLREQRAGAPRFILHDGPPYANGDIHMGHAMNKVLKDIIVRSQSLLGKDAPYIPGWDCHGLPIEWKIEEAYRKKKLNKDEVPAAEFRAECRAYAAHWVGVQRAQFERLGVMGDWDDPYLTMNFEAEAAIVAELLKFADSGQIYRGAKPVMWSPVEKTALAEAEVEYEDIVSTQISVSFPILATRVPELLGAHAVVWTTTPWTIPVNQAIAYGPEVEYVALEHYHPELIPVSERGEDVPIRKKTEKIVIVAADLLDQVQFSRWLDRDKIVWRGMGAELKGTEVRHPMHKLGGFFAKPRPFLPGDFVTTDQGTGLVHMAPDHGEDDFELCRAHGIEPVFAVEGDGKYRADWAWLGGQGSVINAKFNAPDGPICSNLREAGALLAASGDYAHSYPHSWRSKAKLIFRATPQWFIGMDHPLPAGERDRREAPGRGSEGASGQPLSPLAAGESPSPLQGEGSNAPTLRDLALDAIARTRWVPEKSRNRIHAMVEGRPDWVISRQRAWGVPIALYVNRRTGDYLRDDAVNARIVEAFRQGGADAWFTADHQAILGPDHSLADFEPVNDILDVWFDSGSTHAFVIEQRYGEGVRADLYLEGSDQHRGWFQSSLLESCGTRGRAPYAAVLTHGFALDGQGRKMSKSIGNTVDPLKVIDESGADILRLWVASTDYFEDVRIGKEVLATTSDAYRKLRNTFRYLLGALDGFSDAERVAPAEMPELERYILHLLAELDAELRSATEAFEFNRYTRALSEFANNDLSAFFFDIRKDSLYCDVGPSIPAGNDKRKAYRTVLDILFSSLARYAAPVLCFTAEEVWRTRYPDDEGSVHFATWPKVDAGWRDEGLAANWSKLREVRAIAFAAAEVARREKRIGSTLEARVSLVFEGAEQRGWMNDRLSRDSASVSELFISGTVNLLQGNPFERLEPVWNADRSIGAAVHKTDDEKCERCWRHLPEVAANAGLCGRCKDVVNG